MPPTRDKALRASPFENRKWPGGDADQVPFNHQTRRGRRRLGTSPAILIAGSSCRHSPCSSSQGPPTVLYDRPSPRDVDEWSSIRYQPSSIVFKTSQYLFEDQSYGYICITSTDGFESSEGPEAIHHSQHPVRRCCESPIHDIDQEGTVMRVLPCTRLPSHQDEHRLRPPPSVVRSHHRSNSTLLGAVEMICGLEELAERQQLSRNRRTGRCYPLPEC